MEIPQIGTGKTLEIADDEKQALFNKAVSAQRNSDSAFAAFSKGRTVVLTPTMLDLFHGSPAFLDAQKARDAYVQKTGVSYGELQSKIDAALGKK